MKWIAIALCALAGCSAKEPAPQQEEASHNQIVYEPSPLLQRTIARIEALESDNVTLKKKVRQLEADGRDFYKNYVMKSEVRYYLENPVRH